MTTTVTETDKDLVQAQDSSSGVEHIAWQGQHIATVVRNDYMPTKTTFITPDGYYQQAGFVVYEEGGQVPRHMHLPLQRHLTGTPETLLIKRGVVEADLYAMDRSFLKTVTLYEGDIIMLVSGGHCFRFTEDTVLFEIKQGPYTGLKEKELF
jgi:hypothetical protein